jgi:hypothetical protein
VGGTGSNLAVPSVIWNKVGCFVSVPPPPSEVTSCVECSNKPWPPLSIHSPAHHDCLPCAELKLENLGNHPLIKLFPNDYNDLMCKLHHVDIILHAIQIFKMYISM